jgi:hypothetical protein
MIVPPVDEQFVSDALNTIDPPPSAADIAELWVDHNQTRRVEDAEFNRAVEQVIPQVQYYMPESGEAA